MYIDFIGSLRRSTTRTYIVLIDCSGDDGMGMVVDVVAFDGRFTVWRAGSGASSICSSKSRKRRKRKRNAEREEAGSEKVKSRRVKHAE